MKTWVRRSLNVGVLSAGFLLVGGGAAQAADMTSGPNAGVGSGNQLGNVLQLPVDVSGNAIAVGGFADASSEGGASATTEGASAESMTTGYNAGVLSGNQVSNTVQVPVSVCGNSIAVLGFADASCTGGAWANNGGGSNGGGSNGGGSGGYDESTTGGALSDGSGMTTGYNAGVGSGNQVSNVIQAPIDLSGNAISVGGFASADSEGGAGATNGGAESMTTGYNAGILTGNQVSNVVQVPVSVCGNSIAVLGFADASCTGGAWANNGGGDTDTDTDVPPAPGGGNGGGGNGGGGNGGYDGGTGSGGNGGGDGAYGSNSRAAGAAGASSHKAVKAAKKAAKVNRENGRGAGTSVGASKAAARGTASGGAASAEAGDMTTGYNAGVLTGNQLSSVVQIPVDVSGNALAILGFASASSTGGAWANN